jgi:hypothetical protein
LEKEDNYLDIPLHVINSVISEASDAENMLALLFNDNHVFGFALIQADATLFIVFCELFRRF